MNTKHNDTIAQLGNTYFAWLRQHEGVAEEFRHALHELMIDAVSTLTASMCVSKAGLR